MLFSLGGQCLNAMWPNLGGQYVNDTWENFGANV
jgi:hypothetical protein